MFPANDNRSVRTSRHYDLEPWQQRAGTLLIIRRKRHLSTMVMRMEEKNAKTFPQSYIEHLDRKTPLPFCTVTGTREIHVRRRDDEFAQKEEMFVRSPRVAHETEHNRFVSSRGYDRTLQRLADSPRNPKLNLIH
jgi:hypothetical protein